MHKIKRREKYYERNGRSQVHSDEEVDKEEEDNENGEAEDDKDENEDDNVCA